MKQTQKAKKKSELSYEDQPMLGDGFWVWNLENNSFEISSKTFKQIGYKTEDFKNDFSLAFLKVHPDDRGAINQLVASIVSGKTDKGELEFRITAKDGQLKWLLGRAMATTRDSKGKATRVFGLIIDITDYKTSEQFQEAFSKKMVALAQTATDLVGLPLTESIYHYLGTSLERQIHGAVFIVTSIENGRNVLNIEGIYGLDMNRWSRCLELLGWNPVGRRFPITEIQAEQLFSGKLNRVDKSLYDFAEGNISAIASKSIEKLLIIKDILSVGLISNSLSYGGVIVITSQEENGVDYSLIEGIVSQTSVALYRRELEDQLVLAKEKAEESDKLKSSFLANMSHEIRTPMNAILGFTQLLGIANLNIEKRKLYIDLINSKANLLLKIINDIIDASKVEAGQLTIVNTPFNLNNLLRNLVNFYLKERTVFNRDAVDIKLVIPRGTNSLELISDEGRLEQVLTNLIDNALKFTERGYVEFGYLIEKELIKFFVKDTGIGIDPKMQTLIFERFRQVDDVRKTGQSGTGLGLSISKGIVNLMGGKIWVESEPGSGTTFYFTLPYQVKPKKEEHVEIPVTEVQEMYPDFRNRVILIAEDEEANYLFLNELLTLTGANIIWARDGAQSVDLVKTIKKIDLILMDIKMPVMNGYAAVMEIRQINPSIPIIAQTAYAFSEDRQKAEAAGCNNYISKPISGTELLAMMEKYIK